jgi:hypothetical protein
MKKTQDNFSDGIYKGQMRNDVPHGKGKLIDYFQKWTKEGTFSKGGFKK